MSASPETRPQREVGHDRQYHIEPQVSIGVSEDITVFQDAQDFRRKITALLQTLLEAYEARTQNPLEELLSPESAGRILSLVRESAVIDISANPWDVFNNKPIVKFKFLELVHALYHMEAENVKLPVERVHFYTESVHQNNLDFQSLRYVKGVQSFFASYSFSSADSTLGAVSEFKAKKITENHAAYCRNTMTHPPQGFDETWVPGNEDSVSSTDCTSVAPSTASAPTSTSTRSRKSKARKKKRNAVATQGTRATLSQNAESKSASRMSSVKNNVGEGDSVLEMNHSSSDAETDAETGAELNLNGLTIQNTDLSSMVEQLSLIFSHIPLRHLQLILDMANNNLEEATDICLGYDLLKPELERRKVSQQWVELDKKNEVFVKRADKGSKTEEPIECTIARMDKSDKVIELLRLDRCNAEKVFYFLKRNDDQVYTTVLDILVNWRQDKGLDDQGTRKLHETNLPNQSTSGISYAESLSEDLTRNIKHEKLDLVRNNVPNADWKTLAAYIKNNSQLGIPSNFYINALVWFNFNVIEVMFLAQALADTREGGKKGKAFQLQPQSQIVGGESLGRNADDIFGDDEEVVFTIPVKSVREKRMRELQSHITNTKSHISTAKSRHEKGHYATQLSKLNSEARKLRNHDQDELIAHMSIQAERTDRVDLHGLTLSSAMQLVRTVVPKWWDDELSQRGRNGGNGIKAIHVEPFHIITGRGLHSEGGPVIMKAVKKYLQTEQYVFEDNTGSFLVVGKRC